MITKVFEKTIETKKESVKENKTVYKDEQVTHKGETGKCGRCGKTYSYGDNKKDPTACPYCVCKTCGKSLMTRVRDSYAGNTVSRCYTCWYKYQYGITPSYDRGYTISYNHKYPTKDNVEIKKVPVTTEVEVIKDVDVEVEKEVKVPDEKYQKIYDACESNSNLIINNLKLPKKLLSYIRNKKIEYINDIDIKKDVDWYNTDSVENTVKSLAVPNKNKGILNFQYVNNMTFNKEVIDNKDEEQEYLSCVGFYPNVPAYIQGHPLNMVNYHIESVPVSVKNKTIYCNLALDSREDESQYSNRGKIVYSIIDKLIKKKYNVTLVLLDASFIKDSTLIQKVVLKNDVLVDNLEIIYNMLTNVEYYRVMVLNDKIDFLKNNQYFEKWKRGSGFVLKMENIKELLNLRNDDLIIGSPEELAIKGANLDDDYNNAMKILRLAKS